MSQPRLQNLLRKPSTAIFTQDPYFGSIGHLPNGAVSTNFCRFGYDASRLTTEKTAISLISSKLAELEHPHLPANMIILVCKVRMF